MGNRKNCKICFSPVREDRGLRCCGACRNWYHYKCLSYSKNKIRAIKYGILKLGCPCPDGSKTDSCLPKSCEPPCSDGPCCCKKKYVAPCLEDADEQCVLDKMCKKLCKMLVEELKNSSQTDSKAKDVQLNTRPRYQRLKVDARRSITLSDESDSEESNDSRPRYRKCLQSSNDPDVLQWKKSPSKKKPMSILCRVPSQDRHDKPISNKQEPQRPACHRARYCNQKQMQSKLISNLSRIRSQDQEELIEEPDRCFSSAQMPHRVSSRTQEQKSEYCYTIPKQREYSSSCCSKQQCRHPDVKLQNQLPYPPEPLNDYPTQPEPCLRPVYPMPINPSQRSIPPYPPRPCPPRSCPPSPFSLIPNLPVPCCLKPFLPYSSTTYISNNCPLYQKPSSQIFSPEDLGVTGIRCSLNSPCGENYCKNCRKMQVRKRTIKRQKFKDKTEACILSQTSQAACKNMTVCNSFDNIASFERLSGSKTECETKNAENIINYNRQNISKRSDQANDLATELIYDEGSCSNNNENSISSCASTFACNTKQSPYMSTNMVSTDNTYLIEPSTVSKEDSRADDQEALSFSMVEKMCNTVGKLTYQINNIVDKLRPSVHSEQADGYLEETSTEKMKKYMKRSMSNLKIRSASKFH